MLNKDQRQRLSLMKTMGHFSKKEAIEALELNDWDTSMAFEWTKYKQRNPEGSIEEFHAEYQKALEKSVELPQDRYDVTDSNVKPNRQARRAAKKNKGKKK